MQKIAIFGISGAGIVGVLIVTGIGLNLAGMASSLASLALSAGIGIAIVLGALGVLGVARKVLG